VKADGRYDEALAILRHHGAYDRESGRPIQHQTFDVPIQRAEVSGPRRAESEVPVGGSEVRVGGETAVPTRETLVPEDRPRP
jgi:hypothetical protein